MINAVIFDMDGVISDSEPIHKKAEKSVLKHFGITITSKDLEKYAGVPDRVLFQKVLVQNKKRFDIEKVVQMKTNIMLDLIKKELKPVPGAIELIDTIKKEKYKLALASSSRSELINITLEKLELNNIFDAVVSGSELKNPKPDPDIFLIAAKKLMEAPENCLVIEDARNGVLAAKSAGMKCIGYANKHSGEQDLSEADLIIKDMSKVRIDTIKAM